MLRAGAPPGLPASSAVLVCANLVPLAAVLLGLWSTAEVMLLFWAENLVIGAVQLLRFATLAIARRQAGPGGGGAGGAGAGGGGRGGGGGLVVGGGGGGGGESPRGP
ncbi:MAG: DUF6498-containing protein, partial [Acetobacteraceae bacterium]|nr:DUF6498-containing protein [Acetobacteraceae bacterium]